MTSLFLTRICWLSSTGICRFHEKNRLNFASILGDLQGSEQAISAALNWKLPTDDWEENGALGKLANTLGSIEGCSSVSSRLIIAIDPSSGADPTGLYLWSVRAKLKVCYFCLIRQNGLWSSSDFQARCRSGKYIITERRSVMWQHCVIDQVYWPVCCSY